jgi:hypothetical protein
LSESVTSPSCDPSGKKTFVHTSISKTDRRLKVEKAMPVKTTNTWCSYLSAKCLHYGRAGNSYKDAELGAAEVDIVITHLYKQD